MSKNVINDEFKIDEDIRELVEFCNNNGIKTLASCSGTKKDHEFIDGYGQLNIKDSSIARKIAAVIIERGICDADLIGKPPEPYLLYDNMIAYHHINFDFENLNNDVLPKIEEVVRKVVTREIEPNEEIMNQINQIFNFFDSLDRKIEGSYLVKGSNFDGELTFSTAHITDTMRVNIDSIVNDLQNSTGKRIVDYSHYKGIAIGERENLEEILGKAKEAIHQAPNISANEEKERRKVKSQEANIGGIMKDLKDKVYTLEEVDKISINQVQDDSWQLEDEIKTFTIEELLGPIE